MSDLVQKPKSLTIAVSMLDQYPNLINYLDFQKEGFQNNYQAKKSLSAIPATSTKKFNFKCPTCRMAWKGSISGSRLAQDSEGLLYHIGCNEILQKKKYSKVYPNLRKIFQNKTTYHKLTLESNVTIPRKWECNKCSVVFELSIDKMLSRIKYRGYYCKDCKGSFDEPILLKYDITPPIAYLKPGMLYSWSNKNRIEKQQVDILSNFEVMWDCPECHGTFQCKVSDREITECPYCSNEEMLKGFNTLRDRHEKLQIFWNPKNDKNLDEVWEKSREELDWICPCCDVEFSCKANEMIARVSLDNKNFQTCPNLCNWTEEVFKNNILYDYPVLIREWSQKNGLDIQNALTNNDLMKYWWDCSKCNGSYQTSIPNRKNNEDCCPYCNWTLPLSGVNTLRDVYPQLAKYWKSCKTVSLHKFIPNESDNRQITWICTDCNNTFEERFSSVLKQYKSSEDFLISDICPYCTGKMPNPELNALNKIKPYLIDEWLVKENGDMSKYFPNSEECVKWKCKTCQGIFRASINKRQENDKCCPYCRGSVTLVGYNDLASTYPGLLKEWDYLNNVLLADPKTLRKHSYKKVWWICQTDNSHRYIMTVSDRVQYLERSREPCLICKGFRRKREHFISYQKI